MKLLIRISREHPRLCIRELEAVCEGEGIQYNLSILGDYHLLDFEGEDYSFVRRCAFVLEAFEYIGTYKSIVELSCAVYDRICDLSSFRISSQKDICRKAGDALSKLGMPVDLRNPDADIFILAHEGDYIASLRYDLERDFEARKPQHRPYFHPSSLHPKLARALVNLACVSCGSIIADPFCGTGGILIEAGLSGMKLTGFDISPQMVEGCMQNLREFGLSGKITVGDALEVDFSADAVVTDPPYGRASYLSHDRKELYDEFMFRMNTILRHGSRLVIMTPSEDIFDHVGFDLVESYDVRMHKSLTRRIWVFKAI